MNSISQKPTTFRRIASIAILLFILGCSSNSLFAQNVTIPDVNFKNALLADLAINTVNDGQISVAEATAYTGNINVSGLAITDLTGIEAFNNITYLECSNNSLSSLNVSGSTSLQNLRCNGNSLSSLNVSGLTSLHTLYCFENSLTSLNVSGLTSLNDLRCNVNSLTSLNVSGLTSLNDLRCNDNSLTSLNVSGLSSLTNLECFGNSLTSLNVSGLTLLRALLCEYNPLTSLDASGLISLELLTCYRNSMTSLNVSGLTSLKYLYCFENSLTSLNASGLTSLEFLWCSSNSLTNLDVSGLTSLKYLYCGLNSLTSLNVSGDILLEDLFCNINSLTSLDVSSNTSLIQLICENNLLTKLNVKNGFNSSITYFGAINNPSLTCIQVDDVVYSNTNWTNKDVGASYSSNCAPIWCTVNIPDANFKAALLANNAINTNNDGEIQCTEASAYTGGIYVSGLAITDLTGIEAFINITGLFCNNNSLTSLNVSSNTSLIELYCYSNTLTSLNVSGLISLESLNCDFNSLTSLDVSSNTSLTGLFCEHNLLTILNVKNGNNSNFSQFFAANNPSLTCIQVDNVTYSNTYWTNKDVGASYSSNCAPIWCTVNIPDANFKAALLANNAINTNNDGEIQCTEASAYTGGIYVSGLAITDLTGIEAFINITGLFCNNNSLTSLNASGLTSLTELRCNGNLLTSLNLSGLSSLFYLYCHDNSLTSLNASGLTSLRILDCYSNSLTSLNVSGLTSLESLNCNFNSLTSLDVSGLSSLEYLSCITNSLTSLNVSGLTSLRLLYCHDNSLASLNASGLTSLEVLNCVRNSLTSLNVSGLTSLNYLYCSNNSLTSLDVSSNTSLFQLICYNNLLTNLNVKNGFNSIIYYFSAINNPSLTCIQVDDVAYSNTYWTDKDAGASYSSNCAATIVTTGSLSAYTSCAGTPSAEQSFSVSGTGLSADILVSAPSDYEVSTTSGSGFASSVTLTQSGGTVSSTSVYVRLTNAASGSPAGNIVCTSTGATTQNVAVSGTVNALPAPIISTTALNNTICVGQTVDLTITNAITTLGPITSVSLGNNDFNLGKGTDWSFSNSNGGDTTTYNGNKVLGRFNNEQVTYTKTGLGTHSSVTVAFDLYIHDSWDGNGFNNDKISNPDNWKMSVNGTNIINTSFANAIPNQGWSANPQSYPNNLPTTNNASYTGAESNNLPSACGGSTYASSKYRITRTITHAATSLNVVLEGLGLENLCNESWSIDNFEVSIASQTVTSNSAWTTPVSNNTTVNVSPTTTTTYTATNGICPASVQITVNPIPVANFTINNATQCLIGNSFNFTNTSSGATSYQWNMTGAATTSATSTDVIGNTYAAQGQFNVTLVAALGTCTNSNTQTVTVNNPLTITASPSGSICAGTTVRLTSSQGGTTTTTGPVVFTPNTTNDFETSIGSAWTFPNNNGNVPDTFTFDGSKVLGRLGAQKAVYTQSGLGTNHEAVKIEFDLYIHDSWDGNGYNNENANNNPDSWKMTVNGNSEINTTFSNGNGQAWRNFSQAYPGELGVAINLPSTGSLSSTLPSPTNNGEGFKTTKYRVSRTIAHNSDNLSLELEALNLEILGNESWSIDNFNLELGSSSGTVVIGSPATWTGGTATGATGSYVDVTPSVNTTYSVSVGGVCPSAPYTITVAPAPTPSFTLSNGSCSKTVMFTNTNEEVGVTYVWNYGDGSATFTGANSPSHTYTNGTYTVTLSANFIGGCVITTTQSVTIGDQPNATISFVGGTGCGSTVQFTGNTGLSVGNTPTYLWSFGETPTPTTSAIQNPSNTYLSNGNYNVTFTVNNGNGCVSMASTNVTVNAAVGSGSQAIFTATVVNDACGNKVTTVNNSTGPNTNYLWNFGDGSTSSEVAPVHYYEAGGLKTITLTIVGATGCGASASQNVGISDNSGNAGRVGLTLAVSPSTSQPLIGNNFNLDIDVINNGANSPWLGGDGFGTWTFGDGRTELATDKTGLTYAAAGNYTIRYVQKTTNTGCYNEISSVLTVLPTPLLQLQNGGLQTIEQGSTDNKATTGLNTVKKSTEVSLYPNPNNGNFVVEVTNLSAREGDVTVVDMLGREVYKATYNVNANKAIIEVNNLKVESGSYFIVLSANGVTQARKQFVMVSK